jgi:catalase (peroxidase I)
MESGFDGVQNVYTEAQCLSVEGFTKFVYDFVAAWMKVMNLDRFELAA